MGGVSYPAEFAVDGRPETRWSSEFSDPQWIAVDLGRVERIGRVVLAWEAAHARAYSIEVSTDGQNWREVRRVTNGRGGTEDLRFEPVEARWVRMNCSRRGTENGYSLWEFRVFPAGKEETRWFRRSRSWLRSSRQVRMAIPGPWTSATRLLAAAGSPDTNTILNVLWILEGRDVPPEGDLLAGRMGRQVLGRLEGGGQVLERPEAPLRPHKGP